MYVLRPIIDCLRQNVVTLLLYCFSSESNRAVRVTQGYSETETSVSEFTLTFSSNIMSFGPTQITNVNNKGCISLGLLIQSHVLFLVQLIRSKCRLLQFNHTELRVN